MPKKAIIIGAGPAGLTAAYELLKRTDIKPIIVEKCKQVGGISKTIDYKGNKMDFGPHRFFSKSDRVMNWWTNIMPLHTPKGEDLTISYQNKSRTLDTGDFLTTAETDGKPPAKSMLVIQRLTRIYFLRQFFAYPIQLSIATLGQLGIITTIKIVCSYLYARLFPRKPQKSLEDFMINKFGSVLYHIFFKDYTEKVWGMDCNKISADWGAQRIKGVSLSKAVIHAAKALTKRKKGDIHQKGTETSLIEQFLYPATGAGAMWEEVARQVEVLGGRIVSNYDVKHIHTDGEKITGIEALNTQTGELESLEGDYFISTMPIQELIAGIQGEVPTEVKEVAEGLIYRDFVYAGVLVKKMTMDTPKDSWIYIQEKDVKVARMQVYNNWGPYMVADPNTVWLGLEYFCTKGDAIWNKSDEEIKKLAAEELVKMDLILAEDVLDSTVNRMEKTYPAYFGTYERFDVIRNYLDRFANLFLVGRNGMHKYNNTDHSMLTAMVAVDNIEAGRITKENLWEINTEQEYLEEKSSPDDYRRENNEAELLTPKEHLLMHFIFKNKANFGYLVGGLVATIVQFIIFKSIYPFADYSNDSYSYINAALLDSYTHIRPIGYSRFLSLFSVLSSSDNALVFFQYIINYISSITLFFCISFYLKPENKAKRLIFLFLTFNPISLYAANYVGPDSLFSSLTLLWICHLLIIIQKTTKEDIIIHCLILFLLLTFRYAALIFPIITTLAFILTQRPARTKWAIALSSLFTLFAFITITSYANYKKYGEYLFSPFAGWQLSNNVMHMYTKSTPPKMVPKQFLELHRLSKEYAHALGVEAENIVSSNYMWDDSGALKRYWYQSMTTTKTKDSVKAWVSVSKDLKAFGQNHILSHPVAFLQSFVIPNMKEYLSPPLEIFRQYNMGDTLTKPIAAYWFDYTSPIIHSKYPKLGYKLLLPFKTLFLLLNVMLLLAIVGLTLHKRKTILNEIAAKALLVLILFLVGNFVFSTFSAPVVMRYQLSSLSVLFLTVTLLFERVVGSFQITSVVAKISNIQTS
ncbi:NAD(P)-binding protein [Pseudoflavitalea sp. X16]|nr:NAD(P)-binding protein [Paraflavitalea devenefica]